MVLDMGKQLASQQWKLKQIQATQRSSADCSDKGPSFHWAACQHLSFSICVAGRKGSTKNEPRILETVHLPRAQFLNHQNDPQLQNVLIVGEATISSKREIFFLTSGGKFLK